MRDAGDLSNHLHRLADQSGEGERQAVGCSDGECDTWIGKCAGGRCDINRKTSTSELASPNRRIWYDDARIPRNAWVDEQQGALVLNPVDVKMQSSGLVDAGPVSNHRLRWAGVDWLRRAAATDNCGSQQDGSSSGTAQKIPQSKQ